jgi:hypothetical protein
VEFEFFCPYRGGFDVILDMFASFHGMCDTQVNSMVTP